MALLTILAILGAAISVGKYNASMSGIISDRDAFEQLCGELAQHAEFGLDTEFMRERTYFAQLCLLQLSFGAQAVCIDTLALPDLSPLRASMEAAGISKVLHAARQDLEVLAPVAGPLVGLFDTQVAAAQN
jgi:ribonuclease D